MREFEKKKKEPPPPWGRGRTVCGSRDGPMSGRPGVPDPSAERGKISSNRKGMKSRASSVQSIWQRDSGRLKEEEEKGRG